MTLATSAKIQETRGNEGHKTSSRPLFSLRSIAVLSGALLSGEAAKTRAKRARTPCGSSALARFYHFEHPTSPTVSESRTG